MKKARERKIIMKSLEPIYFEIISTVGAAKSMFVDAIQLAKAQKYEAAEKNMHEGSEYLNKAHKAHTQLIQKEASGHKLEFSLVLVHAEDLFMSAENFKIIAQEFIEVYQKIN